ncbi:MAG: hypothetical protein RSE41_00025 [Clostridia bacterium]
MKQILIDSLTKSQCESSVVIDGVEYKGYNIAKPMNYSDEFLTQEEREEMAQLVLEGKAIAVSFFEDLSEEDKINHVKKFL